MPGATIALCFYGATKARARDLVQLIGGAFEKHTYEGTYWLEQEWEEDGHRWKITIFIPGICTKVQVGEIQCQEIVIPARTLPKFAYTCEPLFDVEGEVPHG
jgi:hypothetical protein